MPQRPNCFLSFRSSPVLVVIVVFVAMMLDVILMTSIDPILPSMLDKIYGYDDANLTTYNGSEPFANESHRNTSMGQITLPMQIGILVAAKPLLEMFSNIIVGFFVERFGHKFPMLIGVLFNFAATVGFGYAPTFGWLLVTRLSQAIGSSLSVVAGLALLAEAFPDDAARCDATGRAFGGISLGIMIGYPYGSIVYQFVGPRAPFLFLGAATLADGALRVLIALPKKGKTKILAEQTSCCEALGTPGRMLIDPYILIGLGCSFMQHFGLGVFLATGPAWMLNDLHAEQWSIGVVLAVAVFFHFLSQYATGRLAIKMGRWIFCMIGLMLFSLGLAVYPLCTDIWQVLGPEITVRIGHGMVLCVISPLLARIADLRHASKYGLVYGLYSASYNLGLGVGPIVGGRLSEVMPFRRIYWMTSIMIFCFSFLSLFYRKLRELSPKEKLTVYETVESRADALSTSVRANNVTGSAPTKDVPRYDKCQDNIHKNDDVTERTPLIPSTA